MSDEETDEDEREEEAGEGSRDKQRRRFRDDPLSMFLAVAAVLLGVVYLLEQRNLSTIEDAAARAQAIGADLDLDGCIAESAGKGGATLVVSCRSSAAEAVSAATATAVDFTGFDTVLFVGAEERLECAPDPSTWPDGCTTRPPPSS